MITDFLIHAFCCIDDFCKEFEPQWKKIQIQQQCPLKDARRKRTSGLCLSEIMTIIVLFHNSRMRTFKDFYLHLIQGYLLCFFPQAPSYSRFITLMKSATFPLFVFLQGWLGQSTGIAFVDSTILTVCHVRRISSHKVFQQLARRGKTSTGWFFGFKLHLIINELGEILAYRLTSGNIDDRKPVGILSKGLFGKLFGDRGYISAKLFKELFDNGLRLVTRLKKGMHNKLIPFADALLLKRRGLIESVHNQLKAGCQIEHHRHRCPQNFFINLISGLVAYSIKPKKPSISLSKDELLSLQQAVA